MGNELLLAKIKEYREMKRMAEEMLSIAEAIGDELKSYMTETGQTKAIVGEYKLTYSDCVRKDIDKKRLELEKADIYAEYLKETSYKMFRVS